MTVARILFSETAGVSSAERAMVASVIKNRIGMNAFGGFKSMHGVVTQPNAFEALNDDRNTNWAKSAKPSGFTSKEQQVWNECLGLASGRIPSVKTPSGRPLVYYHDKSLNGPPPSWNNKYWRTVQEIETPHFVFYSVIPAPKS